MKFRFSILLFISLFFFACNNIEQKEPIQSDSVDVSMEEKKDLDLESLKGKSYDDARKLILSAEWLPIKQDAKTALAAGGVAKYGNGKIFFERGYQEVEACSGTGLGFCAFGFSKNDKILNVTTQGEQAEDNEYNATVKEAWITEKQTISNRKTINGFWVTFKKTVAERDIPTLKSLYWEEASTYKFSDKEYQKRIAASQASDVKETGETYKDKKVFEFQMIFSHEDTEDSATSIYLWKNDSGDFEIFNVLEAG